MFRLEEKIHDMESENKVLRQHNLLTAFKSASEHPSALATKVSYVLTCQENPLFFFYIVVSFLSIVDFFMNYVQVSENGYHTNEVITINVLLPTFTFSLSAKRLLTFPFLSYHHCL